MCKLFTFITFCSQIVCISCEIRQSRIMNKSPVDSRCLSPHTHTHTRGFGDRRPRTLAYAINTARGEELKVPITPFHKHTRVPDARSARSNTRSSAHALLFWAIEIFWSSLSLPLRDALNHCFNSCSGNSDELVFVRVFLKLPSLSDGGKSSVCTVQWWNL